MKINLFILLIIISNIALAGGAYKCTINYTAGLKDDGQMSETAYSKLRLGREFVVDKGTGRMQGGLSNYNAYGQPKVLDYGSSNQSFKAITIYKPMTLVDYLYVQEFNDNREKPFLFLNGKDTFSGTCIIY